MKIKEHSYHSLDLVHRDIIILNNNYFDECDDEFDNEFDDNLDVYDEYLYRRKYNKIRIYETISACSYKRRGHKEMAKR